ncbi:RagB/SusD family nutrient uptake outer membrane protein [Mucilaginibacter myungsuensis]|uniref:RagB/SusD family nutrient uptake outer membrane protein n=1 Tax=Mucilaginibacter myungsuensis TaxID=649104 RepID=A0A929PY72_9SPHI|nr:RagB/SusD family nutrient uptake outer membrane protein [Mucilaginibacter myungsuensis]MBE9664593.1 RagB/SusD family nutrient uptake outer membrane protein [Mucilaginibacter myungsuensis]MDN3601057.1 RagB/SusD family nutrient uptake outer membrane protein [Mucilaginibacter myungsuensis]
MNKIYIKTLSVVALIAALTSCKKFVEYNPHNDYQITDLDYLKNETDYRTMAVSVYSPLQWLNQEYVVADIASDNSVAGGESASDVLPLQQVDEFTNTPVNSTMSDLWQCAYEGVARANYLTQNKDKNRAGETISFAGKDAMYGEVYFLRAYYYFQLVKMFGDVPLYIDKRLGLADVGKIQRSPKADVYKQIEADLNAAIPVLPAVQAQKGKITKYAAQALLAKVYIYQGKFDPAVPVLEGIITSGAFSLVADYGSMFLLAGENGPESVFEIQYTNGSPYYNWGGATRGQGNYAVQQNGVRGISSANAAMPYAAGWSTNLPSANLAAAYAAGDKRKDVTLFDPAAYAAANPTFGLNYQVAPYKNTGFYNGKYLPRKGETSGQVELNYANNQRIIRFADVLLMAAEANNRATAANDTKAQGYLNQVRARAFGDALHNITATGTALRQAIWDERRLELAMEGDRFFDLVRTGQAATKLTGFKTGKNEVFAIPDQEILISGLTQNPGY